MATKLEDIDGEWVPRSIFPFFLTIHEVYSIRGEKDHLFRKKIDFPFRSAEPQNFGKKWEQEDGLYFAIRGCIT
jgi:hypothetical protein